MFKVNNEDTGTMSLTSFWSLLLTLLLLLLLTGKYCLLGWFQKNAEGSDKNQY